MISACVDTNILISFLLAPLADATPARIMRHALTGTFRLVLVETTINELQEKTRNKPYLSQRVADDEVAAFVHILRDIATVIPAPAEPIPQVTRDPRDDYLLVPAVLESVEMVVSGDKDLLVLEQVANTRIVSPAAFLALLDQASS